MVIWMIVVILLSFIFTTIYWRYARQISFNTNKVSVYLIHIFIKSLIIDNLGA